MGLYKALKYGMANPGKFIQLFFRNFSLPGVDTGRLLENSSIFGNWPRNSLPAPNSLKNTRFWMIFPKMGRSYPPNSKIADLTTLTVFWKIHPRKIPKMTAYFHAAFNGFRMMNYAGRTLPPNHRRTCPWTSLTKSG